MIKKEKEKQQQIKLLFEHQENPNNQPLTKDVKKMLEQERAKGNIDFSVKITRKCDFCERKLKEDDDYISIPQKNGDILDKCKQCQEKENEK